MTLEERIQGLRLRALYRAVELGKVSQVCRELGISRSLFYRWKKRFDQYGPEERKGISSSYKKTV